MNRSTVSHYPDRAEIRRDHYVRGDQVEREIAVSLGAALITITLSSLGLWWAVLSVVHPLALALLVGG